MEFLAGAVVLLLFGWVINSINAARRRRWENNLTHINQTVHHPDGSTSTERFYVTTKVFEREMRKANRQ